MPPQGARALVRGLLRGGRGGPDVSCVLFDRHTGSELEFVNGGSAPAIDLRYLLAQADGTLAVGRLGSLEPGGEVTEPVSPVTEGDEVRCVWICSDNRQRSHVWSYDGRHRRHPKRRMPDDRACFAEMYPGGR
jgi:hypothetical protein